MKRIFIGIVIGIIFAGTGAYTYCLKKAKKTFTKDNAEKVIEASKEFGEAISETFK